MHTLLITVVVNMLMELASKRMWYTGGKLTMVCHPIPIRVKYENQAHTDGPPETALTMAAVVLIPFACVYLSVLSTTFIRVV